MRSLPAHLGRLPRPSRSRQVGARSDSSAVVRERRSPRAVTTSGTGFVVWAVCGRPVRLAASLGVPVVGGDQRDASPSSSTARARAQAAIGGLHGGDHRRNRPGVPDHVGVREVDDREAVTVAERAAKRSATSGATSRASGRTSPTLAATARARAPRRPRLLPAAVEEVRDVRVLLGLGAVQLPGAVLGQHLGDRVRHVLLLEDDRAAAGRPGSASWSSGRSWTRGASVRAAAPGRGGS